MKMNFPKAISFAVGTVLAIAVGMLSGCASTGPLAKQQATLPKEQVDAGALFKESCARCHGTDGKANTFHGRMLGAQNLTSTDWQGESTDEGIVHAIQTGPGPMPAFEKKLSPTEIEALAAYVRTLKPPQ